MAIQLKREPFTEQEREDSTRGQQLSRGSKEPIINPMPGEVQARQELDIRRGQIARLQGARDATSGNPALSANTRGVVLQNISNQSRDAAQAMSAAAGQANAFADQRQQRDTQAAAAAQLSALGVSPPAPAPGAPGAGQPATPKPAPYILQNPNYNPPRSPAAPATSAAQPQATPLTRDSAGGFAGSAPTTAPQQAQIQQAPLTRPQMGMTRSAANPQGMQYAALDPRSMANEMVRRADNAMSSYRIRSPAANTRSAMQRHYDAAAGQRDFWLNQASSIGPAAQQRFLEAQKQRSQEEQALAGMANQNEQQMAQQQQQAKLSRDRNAARMEQLQAQINAPQQIVQADGTVGYASPGGTFQPLTDASGGLVRAPMQQGNGGVTGRDYADVYATAMGIMDPAQRAAAMAEINANPAFAQFTQQGGGDQIIENPQTGERMRLVNGKWVPM